MIVRALLVAWLLLAALSTQSAEPKLYDFPPPFAKGPIEKIEPFPKQITIHTKTGSRTFTWTDRTIIFRGKQRITAETLKVGETIAIRYDRTTTNPVYIQRIKAAPLPPPPPAP